MSAVICDRNTAARVKALQDGSETCYDGWFGDAGADERTGGRAGSGRAEDAGTSRWESHMQSV